MENEQTYTAPAAQAVPTKKVRRVGTFTLGIMLVTVGILLLSTIFLPSLDLLRILRFAPVLLVILGAEVLLYATRPDVQLKYDWLSMFVCACLILCSVCAGLLQKAAGYLDYAPQLEQAQQALSQQIEKSYYTAMGNQANLVHSMSVDVYLNGDLAQRNLTDMTVEDLQPGDTVHLYFTLQNQYSDAESFGADCKTILDAAEFVVPSEASIRLDTLKDTQTEGDGYFNLQLEGPWQKNVDAAALTQSVTGTWWLDGEKYNTRAAWEAALAAREGEQADEADPDEDTSADDAEGESEENVPAESAASAETSSGEAADPLTAGAENTAA